MSEGRYWQKLWSCLPSARISESFGLHTTRSWKMICSCVADRNGVSRSLTIRRMSTSSLFLAVRILGNKRGVSSGHFGTSSAPRFARNPQTHICEDILGVLDRVQSGALELHELPHRVLRSNELVHKRFEARDLLVAALLPCSARHELRPQWSTNLPEAVETTEAEAHEQPAPDDTPSRNEHGCTTGFRKLRGAAPLLRRAGAVRASESSSYGC
eukprot:scaffold7040_cov256-Pinguiococcus_pyrenoidosus.AAC.13